MTSWKKGIRHGVFAVALLLLAGCAEGTAVSTATVPFSTARIGTMTAAWGKRPTDTAVPPTATVTPTATTIPTVEPMVTPSPGPAGDLEIFNVEIINDSFYVFTFMGEMRNNSSEAMIFNNREVGVSLYFEHWWDWAEYHHGTLQVPLRSYNGNYSCILFPGETGVISISTLADCPNDETCPRTDEILQDSPNQMGTRLIRYQGLYRRWVDLKKVSPFNQYYPEKLDDRNHPKAENLSYRIEGSEIFIEYDANVYLASHMAPGYVASWIILYDHKSEIVNILYSVPVLCEGVDCFVSKVYHLVGVGRNTRVSPEQSRTPGVYTQRWRPTIELTAKELQRVDHIRVLNEIQDDNICINPISTY